MTSGPSATLVAFPLEAFPFCFDDSPITEEQAETLIRIGLRHRIFRRVLSERQV